MIVDVDIGKKAYAARVAVAEVDDDGILGLNILHAMGAISTSQTGRLSPERGQSRCGWDTGPVIGSATSAASTKGGGDEKIPSRIPRTGTNKIQDILEEYQHLFPAEGEGEDTTCGEEHRIIL